LDFKGFIQDLESAPDKSVILLHGCAHNPTVSTIGPQYTVPSETQDAAMKQGVDPTEAEWEQILELFLKKKHYAFFDSAYQGFATGDLDRDAGSMRLFAAKKVPMLVCQVSLGETPRFREKGRS
jgi:aspartate aminotransferase